MLQEEKEEVENEDRKGEKEEVAEKTVKMTQADVLPPLASPLVLLKFCSLITHRGPETRVRVCKREREGERKLEDDLQLLSQR